MAGNPYFQTQNFRERENGAASATPGLQFLAAAYCFGTC
jgi:hypothetical protein